MCEINQIGEHLIKPNRFYNAEEVAEIFNLAPQTLYSWIVTHKLSEPKKHARNKMKYWTGQQLLDCISGKTFREHNEGEKKMNEKLFDYLSRITDENTVINICDKDKTIHFCNKFKDIMFTHIVDSLGYDVIEEQKYFDPIEDNYIIFLVIDK